MNVKETKLWTAIITPLNSVNEIDIEEFIKLLKRQESAKNGIVILGSTGEGLNLTQKEKELIVTTTMDQNLETPIIVGVGGALIDSCVEWIKFCEAKGVHGFLVPTPLYAKPGLEGQYQWFKTLLDTATTPCMLYNVPSRAGTSLQREAIKRLINHPNLWSLKEASGTVEEFKAYRAVLKDHQLFSGDDILTPEFAKHGCDGLVSVASNIWPEKTSIFLNQCLSKSINQETYQLWQKVGNSLFTSPNPIPAKWILKELGVIKTANCKLPLTPEEVKNQGDLIDSIGLMNNWS